MGTKSASTKAAPTKTELHDVRHFYRYGIPVTVRRRPNTQPTITVIKLWNDRMAIITANSCKFTARE